jgi:hypothetical protein
MWHQFIGLLSTSYLTLEAGMARAKSLRAIVFVLFFAIGVTAPAQAQQNNMSFFITSVGVGRGGDLGGLEGADLQCQSLAQAAGAGGKTWHAYLSTQGQAGINAKDRIGNGPWFNAKGVQIASNIADLHNNNKINKETGLTNRMLAQVTASQPLLSTELAGPFRMQLVTA